MQEGNKIPSEAFEQFRVSSSDNIHMVSLHAARSVNIPMI